MRSGTLKNWTVALAAGAAIVVVGAVAASSPAFGEANENGVGEKAGGDKDGAIPATDVDAKATAAVGATTPPAAIMPPAEEQPTTEGEGTLATDEPLAANSATPKVADPFAAPAVESDLPEGATAFDADTVKTDFQCAPPALSPAALLVELRRSRAKQNQERAKLEAVKAELVTLRAELAEQSEGVEKRIADLATAQRAADERIQAEAVAKLAAKDKETESKRETEEAPEAKAKKQAVRRLEVQRLAATTKGMEASEAARFLGALTTALAAEVVGEMKPKLAGAALAKMKPRAAAKIATRVVERR